MTSSSTDRPMAALQAYKERYLQLTPEDNYDRALWAELQIISAEVNNDTSKTTFFIRFPKTYSNHLGTVHGGMTASLFDGLTSSTLALLSRKGFWDGQEVSRDIQVKFFRPIKFGEVVVAECEVVHVGQRLACIRGAFRRQSDNALLATCIHEKFSPVKAKL